MRKQLLGRAFGQRVGPACVGRMKDGMPRLGPGSTGRAVAPQRQQDVAAPGKGIAHQGIKSQ